MFGGVKNKLVDYLAGKHGRVWLGIISFTESIFLPFPTDIFMMLTLLVRNNAERWVYYATLTTITSVLGGVAGYLLSFWLFDVFGYSFISLLGLEAQFDQTRLYLEENVFIFTFIGAVTPLPFKVFVIAAGFMKVNFLTFLLASVLGRSVRLYFGAWLVRKYGKWGILFARRYTPHITIMSLIILIVYVLVQILQP